MLSYQSYDAAMLRVKRLDAIRVVMTVLNRQPLELLGCPGMPNVLLSFDIEGFNSHQRPKDHRLLHVVVRSQSYFSDKAASSCGVLPKMLQ